MMNALPRRNEQPRTRRRRTTAAALIAPLAVLIALTGCSAGTPDPGDPGDPAAPADPGVEIPLTDTACLIDKTWQLDIDDMAAQLLDQLASIGTPIVAVTAFGSHELRFAEEGLATNAVDVTFEAIIATESAPTSTMQFRQFGSAYGDWAWTGDGDGIAFDNWESDIAMELTIEINGASTTQTMDEPAVPDDTGADMSVTCSGDHLETRPDASPFTQRWNAARS